MQVIVELTVDGEVSADGEQLIDFLAGGEAEHIVFVLDRTAPEAETELRVASYKVPCSWRLSIKGANSQIPASRSTGPRAVVLIACGLRA